MAKPRDITGKRSGRLVAIRPTGRRGKYGHIWVVRCDCGIEKELLATHIGQTLSCGCLMRERRDAAASARREALRKAGEERLALGLKNCAKKTCQQQNPQPLARFQSERRSVDGLSSWCRDCREDFHLQRTHGITVMQKRQLVAAQGGCCANTGCKTPLVTGYDTHVDHDHVTGKIRGVLCGGCNRALGVLKDSPDRIRGLLDYATTHRQLRLVE